MNSYISISKKDYKNWIFKFIIYFIFVNIIIIVSISIIDPYDKLKWWNPLNIKYKFVRDDRSNKVNFFKTIKNIDNIIIGSSRVYAFDTKIINKILGGSTYNFGVGTATVEDHLGIIKFLIKQNKIPKNIIIGLDFYTFNSQIPPNSYFLENQDLNFLTYKNNVDKNIFMYLYSFDSLKATINTLKHYIKNDINPRFDKNGWAGYYEDYSKRDISSDLVKVKKEIKDNIKKIYSNYDYKHIDLKRVNYYENIRKITQKYNIHLYIFTTPLHPLLLDKLYHNINTKNALNEFILYLSSFENFTNLYYDKDIYNDLRNFHGTTHTSTNIGQTIFNKVLNK